MYLSGLNVGSKEEDEGEDDDEDDEDDGEGMISREG